MVIPDANRNRIFCPKNMVNRVACGADAACRAAIRGKRRMLGASVDSAYAAAISERPISRPKPQRSSLNVLRDHFAAEAWLWPHDSLLRRSARSGNPTQLFPAQRSGWQIELFGNSVVEQRFAVKARSRSRVICATPFQKRPGLHRSEWFLCCVCRALR